MIFLQQKRILLKCKNDETFSVGDFTAKSVHILIQSKSDDKVHQQIEWENLYMKINKISKKYKPSKDLKSLISM